MRDAVNLLVYEDLRDAVLVGHSAGAVTAVVDRVLERLRQVAYVDAFVPEDGQSLADLRGPEVRADWEVRARTLGDGWRLPGPDGAGTERHTDAMIKQPLRLTNPTAAALPRTCIFCAAKRDRSVLAPLKATATRLKTAPGWRSRAWPSGHLAVHFMPRELADLLLELA